MNLEALLWLGMWFIFLRRTLLTSTNLVPHNSISPCPKKHQSCYKLSEHYRHWNIMHYASGMYALLEGNGISLLKFSLQKRKANGGDTIIFGYLITYKQASPNSTYCTSYHSLEVTSQRLSLPRKPSGQRKESIFNIESLGIPPTTPITLFYFSNSCNSLSYRFRYSVFNFIGIELLLWLPCVFATSG